MAEHLIERRLTYQYGVNSDQRISGFESFEDLHQRVRHETMGEVNIVKREVRLVTYTDWRDAKAPHQHEKWMLQESAKGGMYCAACGEDVPEAGYF